MRRQSRAVYTCFGRQHLAMLSPNQHVLTRAVYRFLPRVKSAIGVIPCNNGNAMHTMHPIRTMNQPCGGIINEAYAAMPAHANVRANRRNNTITIPAPTPMTPTHTTPDANASRIPRNARNTATVVAVLMTAPPRCACSTPHKSFRATLRNLAPHAPPSRHH